MEHEFTEGNIEATETRGETPEETEMRVSKEAIGAVEQLADDGAKLADEIVQQEGMPLDDQTQAELFNINAAAQRALDDLLSGMKSESDRPAPEVKSNIQGTKRKRRLQPPQPPAQSSSLLKKAGFLAGLAAGAVGLFGTMDTSTDSNEPQIQSIEPKPKPKTEKHVKRAKVRPSTIGRESVEQPVEPVEIAEGEYTVYDEFSESELDKKTLEADIDALRDVIFNEWTSEDGEVHKITVDSLLDGLDVSQEEALAQYNDLIDSLSVDKDENSLIVAGGGDDGFELEFLPETDVVNGQDTPYVQIYSNNPEAFGEGGGETKVFLSPDQTIEDVVAKYTQGAIIDQVGNENRAPEVGDADTDEGHEDETEGESDGENFEEQPDEGSEE